MTTNTVSRNSPISVVIPVKNEARVIKDCLQGILSQTVPVHEIIIIDSGSTDGTPEIAASYPKVRVVEIAPEEFNHGSTRNYGVTLAEGELVLFTVGDAKPVDEYWIENLLAGFVDESVVAVCGSQVVKPDKNTNPVEWFSPVTRNPEIERFQYETPEKFEELPAEEKHNACGWDDVSAMYKKNILEQLPFFKIVYGEDVYWALNALKSGFAIAYNPSARVYHFHTEDYKTVLKRTLAVCYLRYTALGVIPEKNRVLRSYLLSLYKLIRENRLDWHERLAWAKYNLDSIRAIAKGIDLFENARINGGREALDKLHENYCGTPPIPLKNT